MIKKITFNKEELELLYLIQTLLDSNNLFFTTHQNQKIPIPSDLINVLNETLLHILKGRRLLLVPEMEYISTQETAEILSMSKTAVIALIKSQKLEARMEGNRYLIRLHDVLHYKTMNQ